MEHRTLSITTKATEKDFITLTHLMSADIGKRRAFLIIIAVMVSVFLHLSINDFIPKTMDYIPFEIMKNPKIHKASFIIINFSLYLVLFIAIVKFLSQYIKTTFTTPEGYFCSEMKTEINQDEIIQTYELHSSSMKWKGILKIENHKEMILLFIDKYQAYMVLKNTFKTEEDAHDFYNQAVIYWNRAKNLDGKNPWGSDQGDQKSSSGEI